MNKEKNILQELDEVLQNRKLNGSKLSYAAKLLKEGPTSISKKIREESEELIEACLSEDKEEKNIIHEAADLWFHTLVLLAHENISSNQILEELESRFGISGLIEKKNR
jgi:phosphoribosyl-ATP pyrophosphohydrolase|tara:strand:+ start:24 stop:350 length:327 start_codon:yes stop_codon:yes gene_type:complete